MNDQVDNKIKSPCVRNCCLNESDICLGCFRSLIEITQWALVDDDARLVFLENSLKRSEKLNALKSSFVSKWQ